MWTWLNHLWHDPVAFKGAVRSLMFGVAMASGTTAGAFVMDGRVDDITGAQWSRLLIAVATGMAGGAITSSSPPLVKRKD